MLGQVTQVFAHLGGSGRAVQADQVDAERLERGERGGDLRAEKHRPGQLHGDLRDEDDPTISGGHRAARSDDRGLCLQKVLGGLHQDGVDAPREQPGDLPLVGVPQRCIGDVSQGGQLRSRAHRTEDEAGLVGRTPEVGSFTG